MVVELTGLGPSGGVLHASGTRAGRLEQQLPFLYGSVLVSQGQDAAGDPGEITTVSSAMMPHGPCPFGGAGFLKPPEGDGIALEQQINKASK